MRPTTCASWISVIYLIVVFGSIALVGCNERSDAKKPGLQESTDPDAASVSAGAGSESALVAAGSPPVAPQSVLKPGDAVPAATVVPADAKPAQSPNDSPSAPNYPPVEAIKPLPPPEVSSAPTANTAGDDGYEEGLAKNIYDHIMGAQDEPLVQEYLADVASLKSRGYQPLGSVDYSLEKTSSTEKGRTNFTVGVYFYRAANKKNGGGACLPDTLFAAYTLRGHGHVDQNGVISGVAIVGLDSTSQIKTGECVQLPH